VNVDDYFIFVAQWISNTTRVRKSTASNSQAANTAKVDHSKIDSTQPMLALGELLPVLASLFQKLLRVVYSYSEVEHCDTDRAGFQVTHVFVLTP